jgi:hypothetical protein
MLQCCDRRFRRTKHGPALDLPTTGAKVTHAFADIFFFLPFARVHTGAETETRALVVHGDGMVCSSFFFFSGAVMLTMKLRS